MRKDMFKVIVERPRRGADFRVNRSRLAGEDDLPSRVGMKRFRTLNRTKSKWLNENLAPLKRYLMKQAGRPWSKVYSEICENLDADNTVKQHVRDHLQDFVVTKVATGRKGEWMNGTTRGGRYRATVATWHQPLYVDPNDGILKRSDKLWKKSGIESKPWRRRNRNSEDPDIRELDGSTELRRINGVWFEVGFGVRDDISPGLNAYDAITHLPVSPLKRHAVSKRQLFSTELKSLKLKNEALE